MTAPPGQIVKVQIDVTVIPSCSGVANSKAVAAATAALGFISKPFELKELRDEMRRLLQPRV